MRRRCQDPGWVNPRGYPRDNPPVPSSRLFVVALAAVAVACSADPAEPTTEDLSADLEILASEYEFGEDQIDCVAGEIERRLEGDDLARFREAVQAWSDSEGSRPLDPGALDLITEAIPRCPPTGAP